MEAVALKADEPRRWTLVFHREAEHWFFSLIAMGKFKHVSAFTWLPDARVWLVYDLGFRRTRIVVLPDTEESKRHLERIAAGNELVTMRVTHDAFPVFRFGLFCTSAVKHLIGLRCGALRPDALFASCLRHGGELSGHGSQNDPAGARPEPRPRRGAGAEGANLSTANPG